MHEGEIQVLTVSNMNVTALWAVSLYILVGIDEHFRDVVRLYSGTFQKTYSTCIKRIVVAKNMQYNSIIFILV